MKTLRQMIRDEVGIHLRAIEDGNFQGNVLLGSNTASLEPDTERAVQRRANQLSNKIYSMLLGDGLKPTSQEVSVITDALYSMIRRGS